jgi:diguanylate cyclase (GGDEF)-like protein
VTERHFDMAAIASALRSRLSRHDGAIVFAAMCAGALFAFEYEFFENVDQMTPREKRISVQELFALTGLLIVSLIVFAYRRIRQLQYELNRRVEAEVTAATAREEASRDALTGLSNRRAFLQALSLAMREHDPRDPRALLLLDLSGFKSVNDRFGHPVGDQLLREIAARMEQTVPADSMVARLGGDEFAVLLRGFDADAAGQTAQRLLRAIEAPIEIGGTPHRIGAGVGIAMLFAHGRSEQELIARADAALYRAKAEGRSAVRHVS